MISDRIKSLREKHRMTQSDLAKKLGITRSSVNAWEMGISVPSTQYLVELSQLFSTSTDYLLGLNKEQSIIIGNLDEEEREIIYNLVTFLRKRRAHKRLTDDAPIK